MKSILTLCLLSIMLFSCSDDDSIDSVDNFILDFQIPHRGGFISAYIDDSTNNILFEAPFNMNVRSLAPQIMVSGGANLYPPSGIVQDFSDGVEYTVTAENGMELTYEAGFFTPNLLENPRGSNGGEGWSFRGHSGVEVTEDNDTVFYGKAYPESFMYITQEVKFGADYGKNYLLLVADMWTEKTKEGSALGHPYLSGNQSGNFYNEDSPYLRSVRHQLGASTWETVHGTYLLLDNVHAVTLTLGQSTDYREPFEGTKNRFKNPEVRVFGSRSHSKVYIETLR